MQGSFIVRREADIKVDLIEVSIRRTKVPDVDLGSLLFWLDGFRAWTLDVDLRRFFVDKARQLRLHSLLPVASDWNRGQIVFELFGFSLRWQIVLHRSRLAELGSFLNLLQLVKLWCHLFVMYVRWQLFLAGLRFLFVLVLRTVTQD